MEIGLILMRPIPSCWYAPESEPSIDRHISLTLAHSLAVSDRMTQYSKTTNDTNYMRQQHHYNNSNIHSWAATCCSLAARMTRIS